eukprot:3411115-Rhodomonas_salina.3
MESHWGGFVAGPPRADVWVLDIAEKEATEGNQADSGRMAELDGADDVIAIALPAWCARTSSVSVVWIDAWVQLAALGSKVLSLSSCICFAHVRCGMLCVVRCQSEMCAVCCLLSAVCCQLSAVRLPLCSLHCAWSAIPSDMRCRPSAGLSKRSRETRRYCSSTSIAARFRFSGGTSSAAPPAPCSASSSAQVACLSLVPPSLHRSIWLSEVCSVTSAVRGGTGGLPPGLTHAWCGRR